MTIDKSFLVAALLGFQAQIAEIQRKIAEIDRELRGTATGPKAVEGNKKRRKISAAGREAIRKAQILRWKKIHQAARGKVA